MRKFGIYLFLFSLVEYVSYYGLGVNFISKEYLYLYLCLILAINARSICLWSLGYYIGCLARESLYLSLLYILHTCICNMYKTIQECLESAYWAGILGLGIYIVSWFLNILIEYLPNSWYK